MLFFERFNFTLTYRPGSKNVQPDVLSGQFSLDEQSEEPENILPHDKVIATLTWEIEDLVRRTHAQQPDPGTGPTNTLFVPDATRSSPAMGSHFMCNVSSWSQPHS